MNPKVAIKLGYALRALTDKWVLMVLKGTHKGGQISSTRVDDAPTHSLGCRLGPVCIVKNSSAAEILAPDLRFWNRTQHRPHIRFVG